MKKDTSWGPVAEWYDRHLKGDDTYHAKVILPNLLRLMNIAKGEHVLDIACGTGFFAKAYNEAGAEMIGVDIAPELIEVAKKNIPEGTFHVALAHKLSFISDHSIDKVSIILALQNISEMKETISEAARVLQPHGKLFMVLNHPAFRIPKVSSWAWDEKAGMQYRRIDAYMSERMDNILMHPGKATDEKTATFHRPLQAYFKALSSADFAVTKVEEWISHKKSQEGGRGKAEDRARKEIPLFMFLECQRGRIL